MTLTLVSLKSAGEIEPIDFHFAESVARLGNDERPEVLIALAWFQDRSTAVTSALTLSPDLETASSPQYVHICPTQTSGSRLSARVHSFPMERRALRLS